jgi:hypothetical protein
MTFFLRINLPFSEKRAEEDDLAVIAMPQHKTKIIIKRTTTVVRAMQYETLDTSFFCHRMSLIC